MCVKWVPRCDSVTLCVGVGVILVWGVAKVTFLNPSVGCLCVCPSVLTTQMAEGGCQAQPDLLPHTPGTGWWFCQMKTKRGWVPASYLEPLDSPDEAEDPEPNYAGAPCPPWP